jgi:type I restriction enzyme, S subunit
MIAIDAMEEMPEGWLLVPIPEVCQLNPSKPAQDALTPETPVTFVPMPAVDADSGAIATPLTRPFAEVRKGFTAFRDYDVIMAKITPCMENGKAAIARNLENGHGFGSTEFHVFRSSPAILPEFVFYFVRQESFRRTAADEMTGSVGQKRVPVAFLQRAEIPLPPLAEQKRIVAKVETLLARVNAARQRLAKVPALLKRFRQSVLAAACSGQLTQEWRATLSPGSNYDGTPDDFPNSWRLEKVGDVCSAVVDCPHSTPKWTESGEICLRTTNFLPGYLDLSEVRHVSKQTYQERIARLEPRPGDVVYSREGGILGIACMIPKELKTCLGQRMMLLRSSDRLLPPFLMNILNSPSTLDIVRDMTGGSASPHLNVGDVKQFDIPVPPLAEQHEIVRRVEALLSRADRIEKRLATATRRVETLTQAILAQAFRGELVPTEAELARREGRDYEPASALLERIRAARVGDGNGKKPGRPRVSK